MICLHVTDEIDVCVAIEAKVIFKKKATSELAEEVFRQDTKLRAEHMARRYESEIVEKVSKELENELNQRAGAMTGPLA
jgi:uncharacterized FlgJ-related protein